MSSPENKNPEQSNPEDALVVLGRILLRTLRQGADSEQLVDFPTGEQVLVDPSSDEITIIDRDHTVHTYLLPEQRPPELDS